MIVLDTTTRKIQILVDATATTTESPVVASWEDLTTTTNLVGGSQSITSGTTPVDIVAAPGASTQRVVKYMSVQNADSVPRTFTFRYNDNGTTRTIFKATMAVGDEAMYSNGAWCVIDSSGNTKTVQTTSSISGGANLVYATPSGASGAASLRALVPLDLSSNMVDSGLCEGRLTLTTVTPVTITDVTGATTIYFTPYKGNRLSLYTGSVWTLYNFTEINIALGTLGSASIPNDIFIYDNTGTLTLEMVAWTSTTARATAIVLQDGVLVKSGSANKRYLGTFAPTATTTTEDSYAKRFLWNMYNRIDRPMNVADANSTAATISSATYVEVASADRIQCVIGVADSYVEITIANSITNASVGAAVTSAIGLDSTTVNSAQAVVGGVVLVSGQPANSSAKYEGYPAIGVHFFSWLGKSNVASSTFYGNAGQAWLTGLAGRISG